MTRPWLRLPLRLASSALLLSLTVCTSPKPPISDALLHDDVDVLVPTTQLSMLPFTVVQRVRGKHGTLDVMFECVVQLSRDKLMVTGMTPYSARAFVIAQDGVELQVEGLMLRDVPLSPVQVLYDLHRIFFRGFRSRQTDGTHELQEYGEVVRERWEDGHLAERSFHALDTFSRLQVLEFEGAPAPVIASRVRFTNLHHGYSLVIENVQQKRLDQGYSLDMEKRRVR